MDRDLAEGHGEEVAGEDGVGEGLADAEEVLDRFRGLDGADDAWQGAERALRDSADGSAIFVEEAAVAGGFAGHNGHGLTDKLTDSGM